MDFNRLYVDSRHRTRDSTSNSDFYVELPYACNVPKGSIHIDGVCLSHSWSTVQTGINDRLYVLEEPAGQVGSVRQIQLAEGTYNAVTLKDEILAKLNASTQLPGQYTCTVTDGRLTVGNTSVASTQGKVLLYSQQYHQSGTLGNLIPNYQGAPAMELIGLWTNPTLADGTVYIHSTQSLTTGFLDLQYHKQLYIHSDMPCDYSSLTLSGATNVVRRVLLGGSAQGDVVNDTLSTGLQGISFSSDCVLKKMRFIITGWDNKPIGMSNHQISWEMIIVRPG